MEETIYSVTAGIIKSLDSDLESSYTKSILAELRNSINRDNDYSGIVWQLLFDKLPKDFLNNHRDGNLTKEESVILNTLQLYSVHQQGKNESVNLEEKEYVNDAGHFCVQYDGHNYHLDMKKSSDDQFTNHRVFQDASKLSKYVEEWASNFDKHSPNFDKSSSNEKKYTINFGGSLSNYRARLNDKTALDRRFNTMMAASTYEEFLNNLRHIIKIVKSKSTVQINYPKLAKDLYEFMGSEKDREKLQLIWSQSYYFKHNTGENSNEK
ncbi:type I-E CRISPR-associated protein Cse2/CasB [Apilactobacillus micheneri]|uniref:Uncharacterized protein n=1 Tax=Apilactobacillus micheneri TaxID=1899430 RepID=A0A9Q8IM03_9LACO|nr:type I-E CRISPR-associated protein Cse2/CasB [Apilactobacillus micheneri]TPR39918.1 hypothetical protein DY121_03525 [Apilactobacillus micheneri]TPR41733.1 hypothetical protein DY123_04165 [Apilactobacillus micheneri]TPR44120.1 hypothetical protein DY130_03520 [Apilactobacillus micheneri]TPR45744.1 hypothetical protein DY128_03520 [Apilactobacillus micheneri]TPR51501.1 hypothetical protein DY126_03550 [Apilactobacillus micheneri]